MCLGGVLTIKIDGEIVRFNLFQAIRYLSDVGAVFFIDTIDPLSSRFVEINTHDALDLILSQSITSDNKKKLDGLCMTRFSN